MWKYILASIITIICVPSIAFIFLFIIPIFILHRITYYDSILTLLGLTLLYAFLIGEQGIAAYKWLEPSVNGRERVRLATDTKDSGKE